MVKKAYLTNGPFANRILLIATTSVSRGRKQFSVILVPPEPRGIEELEGRKINFLKPSCYSGCRFTNIRVATHALLSMEEKAFEECSIPTRCVEDAIGLANKAVTIRHQMKLLVGELSVVDLKKELLMELGCPAVVSENLSLLAYRAVELIDIDANHNAHDIELIVVAGQGRILGLQERILRFIDQIVISPLSNFTLSTKDIVKVVGVAGSSDANRMELGTLKDLKCETDKNNE